MPNYIDKITNSGGVQQAEIWDKRVFIATYGTTTYAEVTAALEEKKAVFAIYPVDSDNNHAVYGFTTHTGSGENSSYAFTLIWYNATPTVREVLLRVDNTWSAPANISIASKSSVDLKAPLASPALTGTPTAPTATAGTNTTQIATTAFVQTELSSKAPLASPTFTGTPEAPTATAGTNTTQIATTEFVNSEIAKDAWLLTGGTAIPEGADLNNYTTTGNYSTATTAIARNLYNAPWSYGSTSGGAFLLKVISPTYGGSNTNYVRQELYTLGTAVKKWGRRRGDNLTWGTWQRVASTDDLPRIITYGDSNETYSGIATEVAAGKIIFCHYSTAEDDVTLPYVCTTDSTPPKHVFTNMVGNTRWTLYIDNTNDWSNSHAALVPDTRTINGHALSGSFSLTGTDINSGMSSLSGIDGVVLAEAIAPVNAPVSPSSDKQIVWLRGNTPIT